MISFSNQISGMPVTAIDGEIGRIVDVLYDPRRWRVLYLELATGWLFGRDVMIPVHKVKQVDIPTGPVQVDLTKRQIEESPAAKTAGIVDEAYQQELMAYYGMTADKRTKAGQRAPIPASELDGYRLDADGVIVGTVRDLVIDLDSWRISSFTADVGGFFVPEMTEIGIGPVTGIDRDKKVVHVSIPEEKIGRLARLTENDVPYVFPYVPPFM